MSRYEKEALEKTLKALLVELNEEIQMQRFAVTRLSKAIEDLKLEPKIEVNLKAEELINKLLEKLDNMDANLNKILLSMGYLIKLPSEQIKQLAENIVTEMAKITTNVKHEVTITIPKEALDMLKDSVIKGVKESIKPLIENKDAIQRKQMKLLKEIEERLER
ncbi:MAG: hypothetical protein ACPLKS_08035 [Caldisericum exile]|uniref:hypothetical protein n=1 Tax=Caldisericum exile TaxID=693075 RepID=UPI003C755F8F